MNKLNELLVCWLICLDEEVSRLLYIKVVVALLMMMADFVADLEL